jgi:hypothetical protein
LRFASWTNSEIIKKAQEKFKENPSQESFLKSYLEKINTSENIETATN